MDSKLKATLTSLHSHLAQSGPLDEESRALLAQLDGDIQQLLAGNAAADAGEESSTFGLAERAQELGARFAVKHPHLEPALRELGNILSSMGI
ncbi:DUF4404 family protein [Duganella qianjiadongensis]|uniref:DUF4404 family protein n=1 Tax=Duganella qianjiadongensis TaxID=2692176 RepID=A0ABW9VQH6_9BURK|nr:DUF4404 family protein [Duganella qianjiadongensis]MYM41826.1 DUF4404 family protein [Duganella qianjiadongensis]